MKAYISIPISGRSLIDAKCQAERIKAKLAEHGHCLLWNEWHLRTRNIPARCHKLFKKALTYPDGSALVIVANQ